MDGFLKKFQHLKIQLEDIKSATGNFDDSNVIGKGGFGKVYKGILSHSKGQIMVAFKRLDRNHGQGDPQFWKEILMLSLYTHENLISLVGFCEEDDEKIIVYEYASHGSLDRHLGSTSLTWRQRLQICLGAAKGLCYLHDPKESQQRVLHRDIKSSNVLLDENWNAKVSDMGLSKIGPANQQHTFLVTNVVGTFGYIDPLYMETCSLTKESNVYSFGVILFEVLCGRLCFEYNNGNFRSLLRMWKKSYKQKKLDEIVFPDLKQHVDGGSLETFSDIAYQCLQKTLEERPKMSHVVEKLELALGGQNGQVPHTLSAVFPDFSTDSKQQEQSLESPNAVQRNQNNYTTRTRTKVQMQGIALGRVVDLTMLSGYHELIDELEEMFEIKGELLPQHKWEIVFIDDEGDMMLLGDDPWVEFCNMVKRIIICSSQDLNKTWPGSMQLPSFKDKDAAGDFSFEATKG